MPLVEYVGNASPQDNTEAIRLHDGPDGQPRSIERGKRALLSGQELRAVAANYQVRVIADTSETDADAIPTEMPSGYDENGYSEDEAAEAVFGPDTDPDDVSPSSVPSPSAVSSAPSPASGSAPSPSPGAVPVTPTTSSPPASPGVSG